MKEKSYIAIVQCDIVKERCSGYRCEKAFFDRTDGFARYSKDMELRSIYMTCGGCCGRGIHRKLDELTRSIKEKEGIEKDQIAVHFSSCITKDNYHAPPCPHLDYLKTLVVDKLGLDLCEETSISNMSEKLRQKGIYAS
ncbi:MAG: CGGC domain-containing protein [Desulfobacterales bacterium]|nr:CGGC domain-containing protein [Desulfobacterales bacterium]